MKAKIKRAGLRACLFFLRLGVLLRSSTLHRDLIRRTTTQLDANFSATRRLTGKKEGRDSLLNTYCSIEPLYVTFQNQGDH